MGSGHCRQVNPLEVAGGAVYETLGIFTTVWVIQKPTYVKIDFDPKSIFIDALDESMQQDTVHLN